MCFVRSFDCALCHCSSARAQIFDMSAENGKKLIEGDLASYAKDKKVAFFVVNVSDEVSVTKALDAAVQQLGPIRAVVQSAGVAGACKIINAKGQVHALETFRKIVDVNLVGTFNVLRLAVANMLKHSKPLDDEDGERAAFVHVASVAIYDGQIGQYSYSASKGGVAAMTLPLARELGEHGIRFVIIFF